MRETKVRILLWYWGRRGGGPQYTLEMARALATRPDVELFLSLSRQTELADEFRALSVPTLWVDTYQTATQCIIRTPGLLGLRTQLSAFIRQHQIGIVNSTMAHVWTRLCAGAVQKAGAQLWGTTHDATLHPGEDWFGKGWFFRPLPQADRHIVLTEFVRQRLASLYGVTSSNATVLPHGVFCGQAGGILPPARFGHGEKPDTLHLLFLGRILPYKGLDLLVEAYAALQAEGRSLRLTIAGSGKLGSLTDRLKELEGITVANRWIADAEIPDFVRACDVAVLPYREASQSGVVAAAHGSGRPVIVTPTGGLQEQVSQGRDGLITEDISAVSVARSINRLLDEPGLLATLTDGARATCEALSWPNIADALVAQAQLDIERVNRLGPKDR